MTSDNFLGLFANEEDIITLASGETLFKKGEPGHHMYVVKSGEIQILNGNHIFETIPAGGIFGEMALISKEARSATAKAARDTIVIQLDEKRFLFLVRQTPMFALRVMNVMCSRLRAMNERVTSVVS